MQLDIRQSEERQLISLHRSGMLSAERIAAGSFLSPSWELVREAFEIKAINRKFRSQIAFPEPLDWEYLSNSRTDLKLIDWSLAYPILNALYNYMPLGCVAIYYIYEESEKMGENYIHPYDNKGRMKTFKNKRNEIHQAVFSNVKLPDEHSHSCYLISSILQRNRGYYTDSDFINALAYSQIARVHNSLAWLVPKLLHFLKYKEYYSQ